MAKKQQREEVERLRRKFERELKALLDEIATIEERKRKQLRLPDGQQMPDLSEVW